MASVEIAQTSVEPGTATLVHAIRILAASQQMANADHSLLGTKPVQVRSLGLAALFQDFVAVHPTIAPPETVTVGLVETLPPPVLPRPRHLRAHYQVRLAVARQLPLHLALRGLESLQIAMHGL